MVILFVTSLVGCSNDYNGSSDIGDRNSETDNVCDDSLDNSIIPEDNKKELKKNDDGLYMIYSADDLVHYRDMFDKVMQKSSKNSFPGLILMEDIDLSSVCGPDKGSWRPIGRFEYFDDRYDEYKYACFEGIFEGNGKTISGLYIDDQYGGALIQCLWEGTVQNLTVSNSTISCVKPIKGKRRLCSVISAESRDGLIDNCVVTDSVTVKGEIVAPFIAKASDWNYSCVVQYCKNYADIMTCQVAGGIVAEAEDDVFIIGCENYGDITTFADGAWYLGGIIGGHSGSSYYDGSIYGCVNYGNVTEKINGENSNVAGIAGYNHSTIEYCVNAGNITAIDRAYDITCPDDGSEKNIINCGTISSSLDDEYAIITDYEGSSCEGINYPLGTPALTDGTALAEIISKSGDFWKQGDQFPVWDGRFYDSFPTLYTHE